MTLTEFLLARIAEDEAWANRSECGCGDHRAWGRKPDCPERVLADCEAKRRIVDEHPVSGRGRGSCESCTSLGYIGLIDEGPCLTLMLLASPYADHPDYREEWQV